MTKEELSKAEDLTDVLIAMLENNKEKSFFYSKLISVKYELQRQLSHFI